MGLSKRLEGIEKSLQSTNALLIERLRAPEQKLPEAPVVRGINKKEGAKKNINTLRGLINLRRGPLSSDNIVGNKDLILYKEAPLRDRIKSNVKTFMPDEVPSAGEEELPPVVSEPLAVTDAGEKKCFTKKSLKSILPTLTFPSDFSSFQDAPTARVDEDPSPPRASLSWEKVF